MDTVIIEHDVPVPAPSYRSTSKWKEVAARMREGDSVKVHNNSHVGSLMGAIKCTGLRPLSRKVDGGFRVWALAPKEGQIAA